MRVQIATAYACVTARLPEIQRTRRGYLLVNNVPTTPHASAFGLTAVIVGDVTGIQEFSAHARLFCVLTRADRGKLGSRRQLR